jgi:hypothetical protein
MGILLGAVHLFRREQSEMPGTRADDDSRINVKVKGQVCGRLYLRLPFHAS